jgi:hypothetical protein
MRIFIIASTCLSLVGCAAISIPASGVTSDGVEWAGHFDTSQFTFASEDTICTGKPSMGMGRVNTHQFKCDDGRSGQVTTRRTSMTGGVGEIVFNDGLTGTLTYGN